MKIPLLAFVGTSTVFGPSLIFFIQIHFLLAQTKDLVECFHNISFFIKLVESNKPKKALRNCWIQGTRGILREPTKIREPLEKREQGSQKYSPF